MVALVLGAALVFPTGQAIAVPVLVGGAFAVLYALLLWRPVWSYWLIVALYLFWCVPPPYGGSGTNELSANLIVLPALAVLFVMSLRRLSGLTRVQWLMMVLAVWFAVIRIAQSGGSPFEWGIALKHFLWLTAWVPAAALLGDEQGAQAFTGALVIALLIISVLTVQELLGGGNYYEWAYPGLVDTQPIVRFGVTRLAGPFGHGVPTSIMAGMLLPFCLVWRHRILGLLTGALGMWTLYLGQGRSAWLGLLAAGAAAGVILARRGGLSRRTFLVGAVLLVPVLVLFATQIGLVFRVLHGSFADPTGALGGVPVDLGAGGTTLGGSFVRTYWWLPLLTQLGRVPLIGYGADVVASSYDLLAGVVVNEWPLALNGWYAYGPVFGILVELCLLAGMYVLVRASLRAPRDQMQYPLAAFAGFTTQAIALHANYVGWTWSLPLGLIMVAFGVHAGGRWSR